MICGIKKSRQGRLVLWVSRDVERDTWWFFAGSEVALLASEAATHKQNNLKVKEAPTQSRSEKGGGWGGRANHPRLVLGSDPQLAGYATTPSQEGGTE